MIVAKYLNTLAIDYGCRPSELVRGSHADLSFDVMVKMKAEAK